MNSRRPLASFGTPEIHNGLYWPKVLFRRGKTRRPTTSDHEEASSRCPSRIHRHGPACRDDWFDLKRRWNVCTYGLVLPIGESVQFTNGQQITFSGLSGVTCESTILAGFTNCAFTTTACFAETGFGQSIFGNDSASPSFTFPNIVITSSVLTTGLVNYSMQTGLGTITGQVVGPVAAPAPEPATYALSGCGLALVGLVKLRRR
jgi:hypothetical protein